MSLMVVAFFFLHRITFCHLPFQSKWLYIGTERGNIHIVNVESFMLSGYVIMWNKAIELWVALASFFFTLRWIPPTHFLSGLLSFSLSFSLFEHTAVQVLFQKDGSNILKFLGYETFKMCISVFLCQIMCVIWIMSN